MSAPMDFTRLPSTVPVVALPDSVTHWSCPRAPVAGLGHHVVGDKCATCLERVAVLREHQRVLSQMVHDASGTQWPLWMVTGWRRKDRGTAYLFLSDGSIRRTEVTYRELDRVHGALVGFSG